MSHDPVNHPKHYTTHPTGVECIDVVEVMTFNVGNAIKYLWRAGRKDGTPHLEDLEKARWYVSREIERLTRVVKSRPYDRGAVAQTLRTIDETIEQRVARPEA